MKKISIPLLFLASTLLMSSCLSLVDKKALARDYAALGDGYFSLKQYEKAQNYFSRASELDPKLPLNSFELAKTFAENGQYDKSFALVEDLVKKEPQNAVFLGLKGYILQKTGKTDEARKCLETILVISPYSKDALFNLGVIEFAAKNYEKAFDHWDQLVTIDPKDSEATLLLAKAAFKTDKAERGFQLLETFTSLKPDDMSGVRLQAKQRYERREFSLALQAYETLVAKDPNKPEDWFELSMLAIQAAEDRDRSLEAFKKAFELGFKETKRAEDFIDSLTVDDREAFKKLLPTEKPESSVAPSESALPTPKP
jgi:tetratricopeptide (TPR) repeat protein